MDYRFYSHDYEYNHRNSGTSSKYDFHINHTLEIYFLLSGSIQYFIEDRIYQLNPNEMIIINDKELHTRKLLSKGNYERILILFEPRLLQGLTSLEYNLLDCFQNRRNGEQNKLIFSNREVKEVTQLLNKIEKTCIANDDGSEALRLAYFIELMVLINKVYHRSDSYTQNSEGLERLKPVLNHITSHLADNLSLDHLEDLFSINKYHLSRTFKKTTGTTIHQYIMYKRISLAKDLLQTDLSVIEVCYKCGFNDYNNFIKAFKKIVGKTPSKYAKEKTFP